MLCSTGSLGRTEEEANQLIEEKKKQLVIGYLKQGDCFGEASALNDLENPYTIEAITPKVEYYKILRAHFIQYFGGLGGEPVSQLRGSLLLKTNWLKMKLDHVKKMPLQQLQGIEFRDEDVMNKLKPTKIALKEISFLKNNPRNKEI